MKIFQSGLHPASVAWRHLGNQVPNGCKVELLSKTEASSVFRMRNARGEEADIIAKRTSRENAAVEVMVYERCLPVLPITQVEYLGSVNDSSGHVWLFLSAADGEKYSHEKPSHGSAAASWIADVHSGTNGWPLLEELPLRDAEYFLGKIRLARWQVRQRLETEGFETAERTLLQKAIDQCDALEAGWADMVKICSSFPQTLVHGEFAAQNIRVATAPPCRVVQVFDWESSGKGAIAVDFIRGMDLEVYHRAVHQKWPDVSLADIEHLARFARILRPFTRNWSKKPISEVENHIMRLAEAMSETGWKAKGSW